MLFSIERCAVNNGFVVAGAGAAEDEEIRILGKEQHLSQVAGPGQADKGH